MSTLPQNQTAPLPVVANQQSTSVIALPDPNAIAEFANQMQGLEDTLSFDRIKVGKRSFEIPTGDGDEIEAATILEGVILYDHASSVLYLDDLENKPEGASNRPDAWSTDGVTQIVPPETIERCKREGRKVPSTILADCPYNQWGSDPKGGRGKWTQNRRTLYILRPGEQFPKLLSLSPTSLKAFGNYKGKRLLFNNLSPQGVVTRITVSLVSKGNNIEYGECKFAVAAELSPQDKAAAIALSQQLAPLFNRYAETATISASDDHDVIDVDAHDFVTTAEVAAAMPTHQSVDAEGVF